MISLIPLEKQYPCGIAMIETLLVYLVKPEYQEQKIISAEKSGWVVYDLGKRISSFLINKKERICLALEVQDFFETDIRAIMRKYQNTIIALVNPGILFEPELELNPRQLILWTAHRYQTALIWPGEEERGMLKLGSKDSPYSIDLSRANYKIVQEEK